jgi:TolA-binding protein
MLARKQSSWRWCIPVGRLTVGLTLVVGTARAQLPASPRPAAAPARTNVAPAQAPAPAPATAAVQPDVEPEEGEEPTLTLSAPKKEDAIDREMRFAAGLVDMGLADYAEKFLEGYLFKVPEAKTRVGSVRIKILTARGRFDEATELIKKLPPDSLETVKMTLTLGDVYYLSGKVKEAREIYDGFLKKYPKGPPPELTPFFMESAYKYAQMLLYMGDEKGAVDAYRCVLLAKPEDKEIERKLMIEMAETCFKAGEKLTGKDREVFFKQAKDLCDKVQWEGVDLWFGRSVVIMAHMEMARGKKDSAEHVIQLYLPMLKTIDGLLRDNNLPLKLSPMAECRVLLGSLFEDEGRDLLRQAEQAAGDKQRELEKEAVKKFTEGLTHFYNVFLQYADSSWAPQSGLRADRIKSLLESMGYKVAIPNIDMRPIIEQQFKEGKTLFAQQDYKAASGVLLAALNVFPEREGSVTALGELAQCYVQMEDPVHARTVYGYIAERFAQNAGLQEEAGDALLDVAGAYDGLGERDASRRVYDLYFRYYPGHKRVAGTLFRFGEVKFAETNYDLALGYYQQIVTNYTQSPVYLPALNKMAYCYALLGEATNAANTLTNYIKQLPPGPSLIDAYYRLGEARRAMNDYRSAAEEYGRVSALLATEGDKYARTGEEVARNKSVLEKAVFWEAFSLSRIEGSEDQKKDSRTKAIEAYERFLKAYPKSDRAPLALSRVGVLLQVNGRTEEASRVFERLGREYPASDEAKDVVFVQAMGLIELGRIKEAIAVFEKMFANEKAFKPAQFLRVGRIMMENGQPDTALKFLERARTGAEPEIWQLATLQMGQVYEANSNFPAAVKTIEDLFQKHSNTAYTVDACFILSRGYARIGSKEPPGAARDAAFANASKAMRRLRTVSRDPEVRARSDLEIGDLQRLEGKKDDAVASYMRMLLVADANNPKVRPCIEKAFEAVIPLLTENRRWSDIVDACGTYLDMFPNGRLVSQARQWRDDAKLKVMTAPAPAPSAPGQ